MPITASDLVLYLSDEVPLDDVTLTGGAINPLMRADMGQFASPARVALVSDGADARVATIGYRDATGAYATENVNLNGVSEVLSAATVERILFVKVDSTSARTVLVKEGSGGTTRATLYPQELGTSALFISSASESGAVNRHEKVHFRNKHGSLTLGSATIMLTADPASRIKVGVTASKGDSATIANRKATPGGITFVDDNVSINVPTGVLATLESIGTWVQQGLLSNDSPIKSSFTLRLTGTSV